MVDLDTPIARLRADIDLHDQARAEHDVEPSDYVEVDRRALEAVLVAAEHHQHCRTGWLNLGTGGFAKLREHLEQPS